MRQPYTSRAALAMSAVLLVAVVLFAFVASTGGP